jgi:CRISPR/Cas system CSM-associated protein Csm3 (group 7 of RAMP superfamily)
MKVIVNDKIRLLSPLHTGSDEVSGIDKGIRRREYLIKENNKTIEVPFYAANRFRGVLRRVIAKDFIDLIGLDEKTLTPTFYYLLFSGGALSKSEGVVNISARDEFYKNVPIIKVFGGATGSEILPGSLIIEDLLPVVKELEEFTGIKSDVSVFDIVSEEFGTRKDDYPYKNEVETQTQQMLYRYETIKAGTEMTIGVYLYSFASELEEDIVIRGLNLLKNEKRLGAKGNIGLGKVEYPEIKQEKRIYVEYIKEHKDEIRKYLRENGYTNETILFS